MTETVLSALEKYAPRCLECGRVATFEFRPPSNIPLWVMRYGPFTRLVPRREESIDLGHGKDADWEVVKKLFQEWVQGLNALGLNEGLAWSTIWTYQFTERDCIYLCDEHRDGESWMVELPYAHFIRAGFVVPSYPTRFERMLTDG